MHFKVGQKFASYIEIDGLKFRKEVTRMHHLVNVVIKTLDNEVVSEVNAIDIEFTRHVDELLQQDIYNYIEQNVDDLDKVMAYYTSGVGSYAN